MSYIPPQRHSETSDGDAGCTICGGEIAAGRKYIVLDDNDDMYVCLGCCDCLAASADMARDEE